MTDAHEPQPSQPQPQAQTQPHAQPQPQTHGHKESEGAALDTPVSEAVPTDTATATPATARKVSEKASIVVLVIAEVIGFIVQLLLIIVGLFYIEDDAMSDSVEVRTLLIWCLIATVYILSTALWISLDLRLRDSDPPIMRKLATNAIARWISAFVAFSASLVGLTATLELILVRGEPNHNPFYEIVAVWAMLVSWALFHWGYARTYHADFYRSTGVVPLVFHGTTQPRLSDFAFLAFSTATSFSTNGVHIQTGRMRWKIVWHSVFSFFFNALIIVLTMNTIIGGL